MLLLQKKKLQIGGNEEIHSSYLVWESEFKLGVHLQSLLCCRLIAFGTSEELLWFPPSLGSQGIGAGWGGLDGTYLDPLQGTLFNDCSLFPQSPTSNEQSHGLLHIWLTFWGLISGHTWAVLAPSTCLKYLPFLGFSGTSLCWVPFPSLTILSLTSPLHRHEMFLLKVGF